MRALAACILVVALGGVGTYAWGHSWYDASCCSDNDCHPIEDCSEIKEVEGGYEWKEPKTDIKFFFARDKLKASHDNQCHVCTLNYGGGHSGLCLYMPVTG